MSEERLLSDLELLRMILELETMKKFTYSEFVIESIENVVWGLLVEQLTGRRNERK